MSGACRRRILITGGAGFIGFHLAASLAKDASNEVVLVDNLARGRRDTELETLIGMPNVGFLAGDLSEKNIYGKLGIRYDEVYHLAGVLGVRNVIDRPDEVLRINVASVLNILDWFVNGGGKKILFASTSETYAWTQGFHHVPVPTPEDVPLSITDLSNPRSTYAASKILGELAVTQYCKMRGLPFSIVRYHNIYGPRMGFDHVIPELYMRAEGGESPLTVYSADHSRSFCYVSDAVKCTVSAMRKTSADGVTFNVGNDREEIAIGELARRIVKKASTPVDILPKKADNDPILRRCPDISRAKRLLGYKPEIQLEEGLGMTLDWYKKNGVPGMVKEV